MNNVEKMQRLGEVIDIDAKQVKEWDFLATHLPFKNLRYSNSGLEFSNPLAMDEEEFFEEKVLRGSKDHNFIVVQGDNGSGKSHFIRWLKDRFKNNCDSDDAVIFIARSQNTLKGALEQIINANIFSDDFKKNKLEKLIKANTQLDKDDFKKIILANFAITSEKIDKDASLRRSYQKSVHDFLLDEKIREHLLRDEGPISRISKKLSSDEDTRHEYDEAQFKAEDFKFEEVQLLEDMQKDGSRNAVRLAEGLFNPVKRSKLREELANYLNSKLNTVVEYSTNLHAQDLKDVFQEMRRELKKQNKNLVLFIEDITSFSGIDRALVDVISTKSGGTDFNEQFCNIYSIVGVTTAYYRNSFPDNLKERVTGRVVLDKAVLLDNNDIFQMAAKYINAVHLEKKSIINWQKNGAADKDLPVAEDYFNHKWSLVEMDNDCKMSIFPFNKNALLKMYQSLPQQTPRLLLSNVIRHTLQFYFADNFPPRQVEFAENVNIPEWQQPLHEMNIKEQTGKDSYKYAVLLRLWGDGTAYKRTDGGIVTVGGLSKDVFDAFGLELIPGVPQSGAGEPTGNTGGRQGNSTEGEDSDTGTEPTGGKGTTTGGGNNTGGQGTPKPGNKESNKEKEFRKMQKKLEDWREGEPLKDYIKLRDDFATFIKSFINWQFEGVPGPLLKSFLRNRVAIEGQTGEYAPGYLIRRSGQSMYALLALAAWRILGNRSWYFPGSEAYLSYLTNWVLEIKDKIVELVKAPPEIDDSEKWQMNNWTLLADFYSLIMSGRINSNDNIIDIYFKMMTKNIEIKPEDDRSDDWFELQKKLADRKELMNTHNLIHNYYNIVQGDITTISSVYFIDAASILEQLEELNNRNWSIDEEGLVDVENNLRENVWYQAYNLLKYLNGKIESAYNGELKRSKDLIKNIDKYLGSRDTENLRLLFKDMNDFLNKTLVDTNEAYQEEEFAALLNNELEWEGLKRYLDEMTIILEANDVGILLKYLSNNPASKLVPYIHLFQNMNRLLDNKKKKYSDKLDDLKNDLPSEEEVREEVTKSLTDLRKNVKVLMEEGV